MYSKTKKKSNSNFDKSKFENKSKYNNNSNNKNNRDYFKKRKKNEDFKKNKLNSYEDNNSKNSQFFRKRYDEIFGEGTFNKLQKTKLELKNNQFVRINLSKTTIKEVEDFLKKNRVKYSKTFIKNCFKIEKSFFNLSSSLFALTGKIYLQDLASQIPINTIDFSELKKKTQSLINKSQLSTSNPQPINPIQILDMCASPGSKTTQIADLLIYHKIPYEITALESNKIRINRLINNLQKQEFDNIKIINIEAQKFKSKTKFDIIILDAPCSGNLIDDNNWIKKRDMMGIEQNSKLQKELLKNAKKLIKENGQIIYSTCSLEPEENEVNTNWAINKLNFKTEKIDLNFNFITNPINKFRDIKFNDVNSIRIMPYYSKTQGFYITKFRK